MVWLVPVAFVAVDKAGNKQWNGVPACQVNVVGFLLGFRKDFGNARLNVLCATSSTSASRKENRAAGG